jgi:hypothetical protein
MELPMPDMNNLEGYLHQLVRQLNWALETLRGQTPATPPQGLTEDMYYEILSNLRHSSLIRGLEERINALEKGSNSE